MTPYTGGSLLELKTTLILNPRRRVGPAVIWVTAASRLLEEPLAKVGAAPGEEGAVHHGHVSPSLSPSLPAGY